MGVPIWGQTGAECGCMGAKGTVGTPTARGKET